MFMRYFKSRMVRVLFYCIHLLTSSVSLSHNKTSDPLKCFFTFTSLFKMDAYMNLCWSRTVKGCRQIFI